MVAQPKELKNLDNDYDSLATQWFIVSDLGLTAFSGNDGIHVFVNSLATTRRQERHRAAADLAQQRSAGDPQDRCRAAMRCSSPGSPAGRAARRPRCSPRPIRKATMPSSICTAPAFDLTDRGVGGRPAPNGLDAFVYAERGVYRSGETVYLTALLRDAQGAAAVECAADAWSSNGRTASNSSARWSRTRASAATRSTSADQRLGADRHLARARLHRSEAAGRSARRRSWSRTTCPIASNSI